MKNTNDYNVEIIQNIISKMKDLRRNIILMVQEHNHFEEHYFAEFYELEEYLNYAYIRFSNISKDIKRKIDKKTRYQVFKNHFFKCATCSKKLYYSENHSSKYNNEGEIGQVDHIHPYSKRDSYFKGADKINEIDNLQLLCPSCNLKKYDKVI